jgi:hypothetical protein
MIAELDQNVGDCAAGREAKRHTVRQHCSTCSYNQIIRFWERHSGGNWWIDWPLSSEGNICTASQQDQSPDPDEPLSHTEP